MKKQAIKSGLIRVACVLILMSSVLGIAQDEPDPEYVSPVEAWSVAQPFLRASGERLRKPGKERVTATGTISRDQGAPSPVQVTWEFPRKVRIDDSRGTVVFDGSDAGLTIPQEEQASDTLELFAEDSLEGFFAAHRSGSNRFLGSGYRMKDAAKDAPAFDVVEVWNASPFRGNGEPTVKQYWFDSRTKLLFRVIYRLAPGGGFVEVFWSDWREVQGERIPFTVERKEGGTTTMLLKLSTVLVSPKAEDGLFSGR